MLPTSAPRNNALLVLMSVPLLMHRTAATFSLPTRIQAVVKATRISRRSFFSDETYHDNYPGTREWSRRLKKPARSMRLTNRDTGVGASSNNIRHDDINMNSSRSTRLSNVEGSTKRGFASGTSDNSLNETSQGAQNGKPNRIPEKTGVPDVPSRGNSLLVVGLGNPGDGYRMTRHNAGFLVAEELARRHGGAFRIKSTFQGEYCAVQVKGKSVGILRPITYMNNSGQSARQVLNFFKLPVNATLTLADEVKLDFGRVRLKVKGSAGGHNGLKSMETHLKTQDYNRLKIGVGAPSGVLSDYVLSEFSHQERRKLDEVIADACDAVEYWIEEDNLSKVMTRCNAR